MLLSETVIDNWAEALKKIALENNKVDEFIDQANLIVDVLKGQPEFIKILDSKSQKANKAKIIDETFINNGVDETLGNALKILAETNKFSYARTIMKHLRKKLMHLQNVLYGVAWTVRPLDEKQLMAIENKMTNYFGQEVRLVNKIDPSLIGGIEVVVANHVFDGSVKGKLAQLKTRALHQK
ncbi:F-type H+-transporting ATPase subunit delta [Entomoplasma freundtii]|uniref:ATP synthase subunit delta n=1 Tax=Entomoplasma freundtii TaxID=74700 RepID=A0A2K8NV97_9MOLU|nr:F0F1 ATP synthase subunit delta [Entomoplasma freundtii]ATZ16671.1 F0F1 ATP synthase subunit delta [Entomoplasma freundtii]TDY58162.1 F-type H+-transporting ATPase subunit delta [Entomoplasma freundtii]